MFNKQKIIDDTIAKAKALPKDKVITIQHNIEDVDDNWGGFKAVLNPKMTKNTANVTYNF